MLQHMRTFNFVNNVLTDDSEPLLPFDTSVLLEERVF